MDFSKFDNRTPAENGADMQIKHPLTREPIEGPEGPSCVIVRGLASAKVQKAMRLRQKAKMTTGPLKDSRVMEDVHADLVAAAIPFIVGFKNVERDGRPATVADAEWFLNLTFPAMGPAIDSRGEPVLKSDDTPKWEVKNYPFASQISDFAGEHGNFPLPGEQD